MIINDDLFTRLLTEAERLPRRRTNLDLRDSPDEDSQRMLNALLPGTEVAIHRHPNTSETVVILRGAFDEIFYDDHGHETHRVRLAASSVSGTSADASTVGITIPAGTWHTIEVLQPSIILEVKAHKYEPLQPEDVVDIGGEQQSAGIADASK